jgi:glycosidase
LDAPQSRNRSLLNLFKRLIKLRHELAVLRSDNMEFFYEHFDDRVLAYSRRSDKEMVILVINFSSNNKDGYTLKNVPAKEGTKFFNGLDEEEIVYVDNGTNEVKLNLKPFEGKVFIEKN